VYGAHTRLGFGKKQRIPFMESRDGVHAHFTINHIVDGGRIAGSRLGNRFTFSGTN
jgi:hypothetical protein